MTTYATTTELAERILKAEGCYDADEWAVVELEAHALVRDAEILGADPLELAEERMKSLDASVHEDPPLEENCPACLDRSSLSMAAALVFKGRIS